MSAQQTGLDATVEPASESVLDGSAELNTQDVNSKLSQINPQRRQLNTKFATIHADQNLRRDLATIKFDRNLVVEKTRLEPQPLIPNQDTMPPATSPPHDLHHSSASSTHHATASTTTPAATPAAAHNGMLPISSSGIHTPSSTISAPHTSKGERSLRSTKKRSRLPPVGGTATAAEVFHRHLVDAVSNVEDSDENEHYVYPYGGVLNDHTCYHSDSIYRSQSLKSATASHTDSAPPRRFNPLSSGFFNLFRSRRSQPSLADEEEHREQQHRPKLRSLAADNRPRYYQGGDHWDQHHWYDNSSHKRKPPPYINETSTTSTIASTPRTRTRVPLPAYHSSGYSSDDEGAPLLLRRMKRRKSNNGHTCGPRVICNMIVCIVVLLLLSVFIILYRAGPLTDISVKMGRVLASDKELIFDLHVTANNPNWWTIHVADADISVFAFSDVVPAANGPGSHGIDPAEYLGTFYRFDEPLSFPSTLFSQEPVEAVSQIRIKSPGADKSGNGRWSRIIRYQYGLVTRGVLKYSSLPLTSLYPQSGAICDVTHVDPSGEISADPDQSLCLNDGKKS